jgi:hypothetical protein
MATMKDFDVPLDILPHLMMQNMEVRVAASGQRGSPSVPQTRPMTQGNTMISVNNQGVASGTQSVLNSQQ